MAGTTSLFALDVELGLNTAEFRRGATQAVKDIRRLDERTARAERSIRRVGSSISSAGKALLAFAGVGVTLGWVDQLVKANSQLVDTADKVGVTTEELQKFQFAATQSGVGTSTFNQALQRFSRRVAEAQQGGGVLRKEFDRLGIGLERSGGGLKSVSDLLLEYSDAVADAGTSQEQLRLNFAAFDSEGAALVNLTRQGAEGWREYGARAVEAGLILEDQLLRDAKRLGEEFEVLQQRVSVTFGRPVLQIITGFANRWKGILFTLFATTEKLLVRLRFAVQDWGTGFRFFQAVALSALNKVLTPLRLIARAYADLADVAGFEGVASSLRSLEEIANVGAGSLSEFNRELEENNQGLRRTLQAIDDAVVAQIRLEDSTRDARDALAKQRAEFQRLGTITSAGGGTVDAAKASARAQLDAARAAEERQKREAAALQKIRESAAALAQSVETPEQAFERFATNLNELTAAAPDLLTLEVRTRLIADAVEELERATGFADIRQEIEALRESTLTAEERFAAFKDRVMELQQIGGNLLPDDVAAKAIQDFGESIGVLTAGPLEDLKEGLNDIGQRAGDTLVDALQRGQASFSGFVQSVLADLTRLAASQAFKTLFGSFGTAGGGLGDFLGKLFGFRQGGAFLPGGIQAFASGGVIGAPTPFRFGGGLGILGEAGPEAIIPLQRDQGGDLGVSAVTPRVSIVNNGPPLRVDEERRLGNGDLEIVVGAAVRQTEQRVQRDLRRGYGVYSESIGGATTARRNV